MCSVFAFTGTRTALLINTNYIIWQSTNFPPTVNWYSTNNNIIETVLTECWLVYWQKPILSQQISQYVGWHSVKCWPTCLPRCQLIHQLIYRPTVNRYGNWESADMAVDMSTKSWPIESTNTRPWGAQITQDLEFFIVPYSFGCTKRPLRDFPLWYVMKVSPFPTHLSQWQTAAWSMVIKFSILLNLLRHTVKSPLTDTFLKWTPLVSAHQTAAPAISLFTVQYYFILQ